MSTRKEEEEEMMNEEQDSAAKGAILWGAIGAVGFGLWLESIGAGIFAWTILIAFLARMARR